MKRTPAVDAMVRKHEEKPRHSPETLLALAKGIAKTDGFTLTPTLEAAIVGDFPPTWGSLIKRADAPGGVSVFEAAPSGAPLASRPQTILSLDIGAPLVSSADMLQVLNRTFIVPGRPVGYVRMTRAGKWTANAKRAHKQMALVQECARKQGFELPLMATWERRLRIDTQIFCADKRGPDPDNVQKLVVDALFYKKGKGKNADKWVYGQYGPYQVDAHNPRVEVVIWTDEGLAWVRANTAKGAGR